MSTDPCRPGSPAGGLTPPCSTFVIAEMACSHDGDPALARVIIDAAGQSGANAIQFQIWQADRIMAPQHPEYDLVVKIELAQDDWAGLAEYSRSRYPGMQIIACVEELASVDFCERIQVDAYKLHTSDLSNPSLVRRVARTGKRIDLSVGASTIDEIQTAIEWIREVSDAGIWLMYGCQLFPTPTEEIHLRYMQKLGALFELPVGYQDHCAGGTEAGFWLPAVAMGMGVNILEKHVTHDRAKKGVDYQSALNPDELGRFVAMVRELDAAKGTSVPHPFSAAEARYRNYSKRTIVAARSLPAGTVLGENDLLFMRAEDMGLMPSQVERLLGRTIVRPVAAYAIVREHDVTGNGNS